MDLFKKPVKRDKTPEEISFDRYQDREDARQSRRRGIFSTYSGPNTAVEVAEVTTN